MHTVKNTSTVVRHALALVAVIAVSALPVRAQTTSTRLSVRSCDSSKFPQVVCQIAPLDLGGVPIKGLQAADFEVTDKDAAVLDLVAAETVDEGSETSTLLLLDLSRSLNGKALDNLRLATKASLANKPIGESVALIALTGNIATSSSANPDDIKLDPVKESGFSTDANAAVVNKVIQLQPQRGTPLHDAISKGITMTRKQPYGRRAIVVMTDGFDVKSSIETIDTVIAYASREGIPIYTVGFGASKDDEKLKRLSTNTGGAYTAAGAPETIAADYRAIQTRLKTYYAVSFTLPNIERNDHLLKFKVKLPNGLTETAEVTVQSEAPEKPVIERMIYRIGGATVSQDEIRAGELTVQPVIYAKAISRVEFQLDGGEPFVTREQPFVFQYNGSAFEPGSKHSLAVRVFGADGKDESATLETFTFVVAAPVVQPATVTPSPALPTATPAPPPGILQELRQRPLALAAIALGVFTLLGLATLLFFVLRRRNVAKPGPVTEVIASPYLSETGYSTTGHTTGTGSTTSVNARTDAQPQMSVNAAAGNDITRVISFEPPPVMESAKTQVLQVAMAIAEVMSGANKGERSPLGLPMKTVVTLGREVDAVAGDLKLNSAFVSRRHAEIRIKDGEQLTLVDLGSASGTKLNGEKLNPQQEYPLKISDEIMVADIVVKIQPVNAGSS